jgi:hypothetical protein
VLIERWPGGPDHRPPDAITLVPTAEGRLRDEGLPTGAVFSYRIRCTFDGPDGEFRTPGVTLTDSAPAGTRDLTPVPSPEANSGHGFVCPDPISSPPTASGP